VPTARPTAARPALVTAAFDRSVLGANQTFGASLVWDRAPDGKAPAVGAWRGRAFGASCSCPPAGVFWSGPVFTALCVLSRRYSQGNMAASDSNFYVRY
jgi:hypothetical protein